MKDIAREAGVSYTTVSYVLNDRHNRDVKISPSTVERIQTAAARLGWLPNFAARTLLKGRSKIVGLVTGGMDHSFFPGIIKALEESLRKAGYTLVIGLSHDSEEGEMLALQNMISFNCDAVILVPVPSTEASDAAKKLLDNHHIPFIYLDTRPDNFSPCIKTDDIAGVTSMMDYLYSLGHRRFLHISGKNCFSTSVERRRAFESFIASRSDCSASVIEAAFSLLDVPEAVEQLMNLLKSPEAPTAVLCVNDSVAIDLLKILRTAGIKVPQDLSVAGYADISIASLITPELTTVHQPTDIMGITALNQFLPC